MSNYDCIVTMDVYELASFLRDVASHSIKITNCVDVCTVCDCATSWCTTSVGEWLLEEVDNGKA